MFTFINGKNNTIQKPTQNSNPSRWEKSKSSCHTLFFFLFFLKIVPHLAKVGCDLQAGKEPEKRRGHSESWEGP